ncbi:unnamed protein product [Closterium sp. NIES-54]
MFLVYVDDILLFSKSAAMIERVEEMLEMQFKCSKMGDVKYYLGMHVERDLDKGVLRLHQRKYCEGLAERYGLQDGGKLATPLPSGFTVEPCDDEEVVGESDRKLFHSMVGALNYAANHTWPDIAFATSRLASVVSRPSHEQLEAAKRLVRYADGTSIGGYVCLFGGGAKSWRSKKQNEVGLSSCETEYMSLHHGAKEVAPRAWYHKLEETLLAGGFKKSECDHSLFLLQEKDPFLMFLVYVDDILLFSKSAAMIERVEEMLEMQFKCSKMGDVKYYLGMHVERDLDKGVLRLHQRKYCEGLAERYGLQDGGKLATPLPSGFTVEPCDDEEVVGESDRKLFHSMVGALNYAANHTWPDIAFATSRLASVVSRPSHEQLEAAKRLVRYADGTSIGGYVCLFGGGAKSWRSKKQNEVGLSSCETEYMSLHHGAKEVVWLRRLLEEIGVCQKEPTVIFCDNESAVKLAKNA